MFDFHFFLGIEKWKKFSNETIPEIKKNNQSWYNRFSRNCRHLTSILFKYLLFECFAMEDNYIIFLSGEGEGKVERRVKKM